MNNLYIIYLCVVSIDEATPFTENSDRFNERNESTSSIAQKSVIASFSQNQICLMVLNASMHYNLIRLPLI